VALCDASRAEGPLCLVAGGETVVTVKGSGRGGRSQELALSAALAIERRRDVALLAAGTDGADGPTDAAGAFVDGDTVARGRRAGLDAAEALAANDSHSFFRREGGLIRTGATGTNVMDLALVLRDPRRWK
jgi:glycerate-2-kinase